MPYAQRCVVQALRLSSTCAVLVVFLALAVPMTAGAQLFESVVRSDEDLIGPAAGTQEYADIERGGDIFLAVWVDRRTEVPGDGSEYATEGDVYAARLDASGNLLDETPIILSQDAADQVTPRASWNGENWLVTWVSYTPIDVHPWTPVGIEAVRVSPDGEVLDETPINVFPTPAGSVKYLATGSDGTDWVVFISETVQSGMNQRTYLRGIKFSPAGSHLGSPVTMFSPSCCYFFPLGTDVTYAQGEYFLVFEGIPSSSVNDAIVGMRFTQSLQRIDNQPFQIVGTSGVFREPRVTTDGTDYFVSWYHYTSYPPASTYPIAARVMHDGTVLDPAGIDLSAGTGFGARYPRVAWDGTNWVAGWTDNLGARLARVTPGGTLLDPGGVSLAWLGVDELTEAPGGGVRMVWTDGRAGGELPDDIYSTHVSTDLAADEEAPISLGAPSHSHVDVALAGNDGMLAFRSDVSGGRRILAQDAADYSAGRTGDPVVLATGFAVSDPEIAWNGSLYLAVWSDEDAEAIYGARLLQDGTVLDDPPILVMPGLEPDVAAVGGDFLVVGTDEVGSYTTRKSFGARVRGSDGVVLDAPPILLGQSYARAPKVAGMSARWLVTWGRYPSYDDPAATVWAAFVDADGSAPGEFGVVTSSTFTDEHLSPAIGSNLGIALIVWQENRLTHGEDWNLYGRRVLVDGTVFDTPTGFQITEIPADERNAAVGWNGSTFQLAFEVTEQLGWFDHSAADIYGTRVDQYGAVLSPMGFPIEVGAGPDVMPAVGSGASHAVVASSIFACAAPCAAYRIGTSAFDDGTTSVPGNPDEPVASAIHLAGAFPNPTAGPTRLRFILPESARVSLRVYDISGRLVRDIVDSVIPAGEHDVRWDGRDNSGETVANGMYLYRMEAGSYQGTGKLVVLR